MADNSKQARWIVTLYDNLAALFHAAGDVLVGMNMFWYPVEGESGIRNAPDVFVVFGRPKGDRSSYKQWEENNVPLTVVFEVLSPSNTFTEMSDKLAFYDEYGAEEYYIYDPDTNRLQVFLRRGDVLVRVRKPNGFVSPRLGVRFDLSAAEMIVYRPDGRRFPSFEELQERAEKAEQRAARLAELTRKALRQQATAEELQELEALIAPPSPPSP
jgi:Uma2 family endonuclease